MPASSTSTHYDYDPTQDCVNPDVVHICHKCNTCGRFSDRYRMRLDEIEAMQYQGETEAEEWARICRESERFGQHRLTEVPA